VIRLPLVSNPVTLPPLEETLAQIRAGKMAIVVDDERPDAEGDLVMAAERVTPREVNFMAINARGIVSVAIPERRMRELGIPLLPASGTAEDAEQVGASVESRIGVTTGISAADRATTIQVLASERSGPEDVVMPGHIPPLMALSGGVLMRPGRAEAAVDLVRLAGMRPAAAICSILNEEGEAARMVELHEFGKTHFTPICSIR